MTKDGPRDKISRDLQALYGDALAEPVPQDMKDLLAKLNGPAFRGDGKPGKPTA